MKNKLMVAIACGMISLGVSAQTKEGTKLDQKEVMKNISSEGFKNSTQIIESQYKAITIPAEKKKFRDNLGMMVVASMKPSLPIIVDYTTSTVNVEYTNELLVYTNKITDDKTIQQVSQMSNEQKEQTVKFLKTQVSSMLCGSNLKTIFAVDLGIKYNYLFKDGKKFTEIVITKKDCA